MYSTVFTIILKYHIAHLCTCMYVYISVVIYKKENKEVIVISVIEGLIFIRYKKIKSYNIYVKQQYVGKERRDNI